MMTMCTKPSWVNLQFFNTTFVISHIRFNPSNQGDATYICRVGTTLNCIMLLSIGCYPILFVHLVSTSMFFPLLVCCFSSQLYHCHTVILVLFSAIEIFLYHSHLLVYFNLQLMMDDVSCKTILKKIFGRCMWCTWLIS